MKGFVVIAQNNDEHDYLKMAYMLALNLKITQSDVQALTVIKSPDMDVPEKYASVFDQVIDLQVDDASNEDWKIHNKWQVYELSPYDHTMFIDVDMYFPTDMKPVWDMMEGTPFAITTKARTYRDEPVTSRMYRQAFDRAELPDVYSAMVYFEKGDYAYNVFDNLKNIYHHWDHFRDLYKYKLPQDVSGDLAFAVAIQTLDIVQQCTLFFGGDFVHLKTRIQHGEQYSFMREDWTFHFHYQVLENGGLVINEFKQEYPVHYVDKTFASDDMIETLEKMVA